MTPPLFMLFFFLSGAGLDLSVLPSVGLIGLIYIFGRVLGKVLGALFGGKKEEKDEKEDAAIDGSSLLNLLMNMK